MDASRRKFLISIARAATYAAPVVLSLAAPERLAAGGWVISGGTKTKNVTTGFSTSPDATSSSTTTTPSARTAPWAAPPPGSQPPGGQPPDDR